MEGPAAKPKGRKRLPKTQHAGGAATALPARRTATEATGTEPTEQDDDGLQQPRPSLSQRVTRSLRQLSQLGAGSKTEEGGEVEQQLLLHSQLPDRGGAAATEPADVQHQGRLGEAGAVQEEERREEGEEAGDWRSKFSRDTAALGCRLREQVPRMRPVGTAWLPAAVAALLVALLLLTVWMLAASQAGTNRCQVASLQHQLTDQLQSSVTASVELQRQLAELQSSVQKLGARLGTSGVALEELRETCTTQADASASLATELVQLRQAVAEAEAAFVTAQRETAAGTTSLVSGPLLRQVVQEEVSEALELFAADRTALPDYALAAGGAEVLAHSPALLPGGLRGRISALLSRTQKLLLAPISPGACLPLMGSAGYVDVRLRQRIRPSAFTYEHIPAAIAFDIRSAPRNLTLMGFLGPPPPPLSEAAPAAAAGSTAVPEPDAGANSGVAAQGIKLGSFSYDAHSRHPVQTFQLAPEAQQAAIDHVRLAIAANHGHPGYTCLYRLRVHGTPA